MILIKPISAMNKCFSDETIQSKTEVKYFEALKGEECCFQLAYTSLSTEHFSRAVTYLKIESPIKNYIQVNSVAEVPVHYPAYNNDDDWFVRKTPGMYPDVLDELDARNEVFPSYHQLKALFISVKLPENTQAGDYPIHLSLINDEGEVQAETEVCLHCVNAVLPEQTMSVTQWFHCDCIADYYNVEVFSEKHWAYIENFIKTAVQNGINTILTPIFTPPLDTAVGHERKTVQLIDITKTPNGYLFGFQKLERWVKMCIKNNVRHLEISHLYSQWGASHSPKIMGTDENGDYVRLFGWETDATSEEYRNFLRTFLQAFLGKMKELNADRMCYFHISDEPNTEQMTSYQAAKSQIEDLLKDYRIMDAMSNVEYYKKGIIRNPIPDLGSVNDFLKENVEDMWVYYCCGLAKGTSNRFIAMPMQRTRVIGLQFYKYHITGFLQWGYNFYNSCGSLRALNPYLVNDGDAWVPAGDCFSVYPGANGKALASLRIKAFWLGLQDTRALMLAEQLAGRQAVSDILNEKGELTFFDCPKDNEWIENVRIEINHLIEKNI